MSSATHYNVMPPPNATLCHHLIACRVGVQNLIRAEGVRGRFELGQNSVLQAVRCDSAESQVIHQFVEGFLP
jgi:hypothetical protein